ncbi:MAG TPA: glycosyltransferase family 4 protein [Solirubrobacteraceae bacterium]|nr:glycosyltransferase family 4 protein [Solirubrobacteraceae bacterium]
MRILIVYDCLFPYTVGGGERWLRNVAQRLACEGHDVTYLTLRQWDPGVLPELPGARVVAAGPRMKLYVDGRRRILPPLVFGLGALLHLVRHGRRYDVVHTAAFPFFSLLAAAAMRPLGRFTLVAEWYEVWTREYWESYLGRGGGRVGHAVQRLCARVPQRAICFSRLHAQRLREEGLRGDVVLLEGMFSPAQQAAVPGEPAPANAPGEVVFAGRHIPEKRVPALVPALVAARERLPGLRAVIFGDGPQRPEVLRRIADAGASAWLRAPGFVSAEEIDAALAGAPCMVLPSSREGYGLIVVESAAAGVPSVVVAGPDNAAVELVEEGVNGTVAASASASDLADAIVRVVEAGPALRASTAAWFAANAGRLSSDSSLRTIVATYETGLPSARP